VAMPSFAHSAGIVFLYTPSTLFFNAVPGTHL